MSHTLETNTRVHTLDIRSSDIGISPLIKGKNRLWQAATNQPEADSNPELLWLVCAPIEESIFDLESGTNDKN